jgi:predicted NACHT family NTPase
MGGSRKLRLTNWTNANNALIFSCNGNKSELAKKVKMSRTTVTAFFKQEPLREGEFCKICKILGLNWEVNSEVSTIAPSEPKTDWIEEVRSRCCQKILHQHSRIQLLNQTEVGVDELYVDVWLLNRSPRTFQVSESKLLESFDLRNDRLGMGDRIQRNEGMAVANENPKLLILGKPGSGKTTSSNT